MVRIWTGVLLLPMLVTRGDDCPWSTDTGTVFIACTQGSSYNGENVANQGQTRQMGLIRYNDVWAHLGECVSKGRGVVDKCSNTFPIMCNFKSEFGDFRCAKSVRDCKRMNGGGVRKCPKKDYGTCFVLILFCLCILPLKFGCVYSYQKLQKKYERQMSRTVATEEYTQKLVSQLMPSLQMEAYQFQGISPVPENQRISLEFESLGMTLKSNDRCILEGVTGSMNSGNMSGILGPSGAGKTTFLNVLCGKGFYGNMTGTVKINGKVSEVSTLKPVMGFVPQDDIVHEPLTVRENFYYSACLRNSGSTSKNEIRRIVEDVVAVMQLRHVQNSVVGGVEERGISGGQRKRVNIGLELAARPSIMFLDEPTSGLDATAALTVIQSIKKLTDIGMTVVMVIHQPRYQLFELCDEVLLLGVGGRTVYTGDAIGAKPYFESIGFVMPANENPADWFMDIISGQMPNTQDTDFKPYKLFGMWENHLLKSKAGDTGAKRKRLSRALSNHETEAFIRQELTHAFEKVDGKNSGYITKEDLKSILTAIMNSPPQEDALLDLFPKMSDHKDYIAKESFLTYFMNLQKVTADYKPPPMKHGDDIICSCGPFYIALEESPDKGPKERSPEKPGALKQFGILFERALIRWNRQSKMRFIGYALVMVAGLIQGLLVRGKIIANDQQFPMNIFTAQTNLSLLVAINRLKVFGGDRPMFWRESSSGINVLSFYLARMLIDIVATIVECSIFLSVWYIAAAIRGPVSTFLPGFFLAAFVGAGVGYILSTIVPPTNATLASAVCIMIGGAAIGLPNLIVDDIDHKKTFLFRSSFLVWSLSMAYIGSVEEAGGIKVFGTTTTGGYLQEDDCGEECNFPDSKFFSQYRYVSSDFFIGDVSQQTTCFLVLLCFIIVLYSGGYLGLRFTNKEKQV